MITLLFILQACSSEEIRVFARTQGNSVSFEIKELSLRKTGQDWYDDWIQLEHPDSIDLTTTWEEIGWISTSEEKYHHLFLDADRVLTEGQDIKDIVEPTYLGRPISTGRINLELGILDAPNGAGLFLLSAE